MASHHLTIVQINDTHGYLEAHPELVWQGGQATYPVLGGYARIATLIGEIRGENPEGVVTLDNGDTFHGTFAAVASRGLALVPLINALGLDAMTAHWEFAWGPAHFMALAAELGHPVLAINCYQKDTGARPFPASLLIERAGLRVGVIGIAATIIDKSMPPHFSEGLRFTDGVEELPAEICRLRAEERADFIIVLSHLGFPQDAKVAQLVSGIDVIVSGHTHNRLETPARFGGTLIIQSGCHGSFLGRLDLTVESGRTTSVQHRLIPVDGTIAPDPAMTRMVDDVLRPHRKMLGEKVGVTHAGLHRNTTLAAPMDDILLEAIAAAAETDIAFSNGWRYGAPIPPGPVTMNDLWNIIPGNPPISTVELSGAEIIRLFEDNIERTFAPDPLQQMGGYLKRFRGLRVYGKLENPRGHRIEMIFANEKRVSENDIFKVAFVTVQGVPPELGRRRQDLPIKAIDALRTYFMSGSGGRPEAPGRFIAV